jgi:PKD repeat protein
LFVDTRARPALIPLGSRGLAGRRRPLATTIGPLTRGISHTLATGLALLMALFLITTALGTPGFPSSPLGPESIAAGFAKARPTHAPKPTPTPAGACVTSGPGTYSVTVCITAPTDGSTISGSTTVTATVTSTDPTVLAQRGIFTIDGVQLLMDFTSPYTFTLDSRRWIDGTHRIGASALMRDGFATSAASIALTFSNGVFSPPVNPNQFTPTSGTAPASGAPLVVAATGDGAGGEVGETGTVGLIGSWNPNLMLYLGDVYEDGTPMEFDNWYGKSGTAGTYGQFRPITDPVIGNHEYIGNTAAGYFYYWDNIPSYYSYNAGGWHFIALNSTSQFGQMAPGSPQYQWLQQDLAAHSGTACTVVYYHHPLFNTGPEGSTTALQPIWALLAQYHVTMVLNGHDHDYQRFVPLDGSGNPSPAGVTEFIVGSGGHGHQSPVTTDSRQAASDFTDFGAMRLALYPTSATFEFQTTTGAVVDSGLIPCRNTVDGQAPSAPSGLAANASGPAEIDLAWGAASDNIGVAGYDVYRDGDPTPIATLAPDARAYADSPLAPDSTHSYVVKAFDAAGNVSAPAGPVSATTDNAVATVTISSVADAYVSSAKSTTNYGSATTLRVASGSTIMNSYLRFDLSGLPGTIQSATLRIYANSSGSTGYDVYTVANSSWGENSITYANAPPMGSTSSGSSGALTGGTWTSVDLSGLAAAAQGGPLSIGLRTTGSQRSLASRETSTPPQLVIQLSSGSGGAPTASFSASSTTPTAGAPVSFTDTSGGAPTSWAWDFGDGSTSTLQNPSHTWSTSGTYTVTLVASNAYGDSAPATATIGVNADTISPTMPGNLTASAVSGSEIDLAWTASTDNIGVTGYEVFRDGSPVPLVTVGSSTLGFHDTGLAPGSYHSYQVDAIDGAGNHSGLAGPGGPHDDLRDVHGDAQPRRGCVCRQPELIEELRIEHLDPSIRDERNSELVSQVRSERTQRHRSERNPPHLRE